MTPAEFMSLLLRGDSGRLSSDGPGDTGRVLGFIAGGAARPEFRSLLLRGESTSSGLVERPIASLGGHGVRTSLFEKRPHSTAASCNFYRRLSSNGECRTAAMSALQGTCLFFVRRTNAQ